MRILVLTFYFEPDLCAGSFRTTPFVKELQKLSSNDDNIDVITTMPNRYGTFFKDALSYETKDNISIFRINLGRHQSGFLDQSFLFGKFAWNVYKIVRKREKYDIVYATSSRLMTAFLGAIISNKQKSKLFLDIRDIFIDTLESIFSNSMLRYIIPLFKQIEKYTILSADHINLVSEGFIKYFTNLNNNVSYTFYSNGIDDIFLKYDFKNIRINEKKIITYAGNIGEGQGLEKIIPDLCTVLGDLYEIHIVGDGGKKQELLNMVDKNKNIKFFDPVSRDKLLEIYKNSDFLFLHLNDYDAFKKVLPSKIFEYGATNKKIIAGVAGYASEFIEKNVDDVLVFEPCNINDFKYKFNKYKFNDKINRSEFINRYGRENIMKELAKKVYSI
jgi:hypothetical protein